MDHLKKAKQLNGKQLLVLTNSSNKLGHSILNWLAPVSEPSPPIATKFVIPFAMRFAAAFRRPSRSRKSIHRAEPIIVPPWNDEGNSNRG